MIQDWFMAKTFRENASFTATPVTSFLWGDPNLMFNVKKSLFSPACICITAITVSGSYRHTLSREHTSPELSLAWLFFFCNVRAKWFLHLDSKAERKRKNKTNKKKNSKQICPGRCLPSSLHIACGIQLLGPQALPPPRRPSCKELACHSQVQFKNSVNLNFENDFFSYFQTHEAWLS